MPYQVNGFDDQSSAKDDLIPAIGYGIGSAFFIPGVDKLAAGALKVAAKAYVLPEVAMFAAAPFMGAVGAVTGRPLLNAAKAIGYVGANSALMLGRSAAYTVGKTASWVWQHPTATTTLVGATGLGTAMMGRRQPETSLHSPGVVEAMGGTSDYGVQGMMRNMNATGDIVLGANNRR